jgi:AcrR family transcriptional regulator
MAGNVKTLTAVQQQRRERILSSARSQLSILGYEGLNMRDLAVVAEVSTSTLYNLYQSKDTLILAALEDVLAGLNDVVISSGAIGLDKTIVRIEGLADQIVATPQYAEAMGRMLFNADQPDPIVKALMSAALALHTEELLEMKVAGELRDGVDEKFLARSMASTGWSVVLLWMKGYAALHDFRQEYIRNSLATLLPWVTAESEQKLRTYF